MRRELRDRYSELGIETSYLSLSGEKIQAEPDALEAVAKALDPEPGERRISPIVSPVVVCWGSPVIELHLSERRIPDRFELEIELEGESKILGRTLESSEALPGPDLKFSLADLPVGYHRGRIKAAGVTGPEASFWLFCAPAKAYFPEGKRLLGAFTPVYALSSERSWGVGDLGDLKSLSDGLSRVGVDFIATLPLLACFLEHPIFEPSPYSPATRLFWNEVLIDIPSSPQFQQCEEARRLASSKEILFKLKDLRSLESVDYERVHAIKSSVLREMASHFASSGGFETSAFREFLAEASQLEAYSRFRAACQFTRSSWQSWPERMREGKLQPGDYRESDFRYHLYVQFLMHEQLKRLKGLYLDYPTGVHPDGFDPWAEREAFVQGIAAGAPPDPFFIHGQNWGFQPLHPRRGQESGHRYFRDSIRAHLRYAKILRLDHVMSLQRLFWIPNGMGARSGVYVRYPLQELLAILCIESVRHGAIIVGEDLGTVPPRLRSEMAKRNLNRMFVFQFEIGGGAKKVQPERIPRECIASLNTHDMPPFAAFWKEADLPLRRQFKTLRTEELPRERKARRRQRQEISRLMLGPGHRDAAFASVRDAAHRYLAASRARMVCVSLEDLLGETRPQNVPGTWREYPNWRRKLKKSVEQLLGSRAIGSVFESLSRLRRDGKQVRRKAG